MFRDRSGQCSLPLAVGFIVVAAMLAGSVDFARAAAADAAPTGWAEDLSPIGPADWTYERARHLLGDAHRAQPLAASESG